MRRRAQRDLDALDKSARSAIVAALAALARGEPNVDVRRLQGTDPPQSRLRVGRYRVIFGIEPGVITVERVLDRRDAYR
jgi:mRNA-degrading endonuclease RelE of RelBE toxin-antitoxin system